MTSSQLMPDFFPRWLEALSVAETTHVTNTNHTLTVGWFTTCLLPQRYRIRIASKQQKNNNKSKNPSKRCKRILQMLTEKMRQGNTSSGEIARKKNQKEEWEFREGREGLARFRLLLPTWPLARRLLPIKFVVKQAETLLQNY